MITANITSITAADWDRIWQSRQCRCGSHLRRVLISEGDKYTCDTCGFTAMYTFEYTDDGWAVVNGYGWRGAPYSDGTYPQLRRNEEYSCYYRDLEAERRLRQTDESGDCPF